MNNSIMRKMGFTLAGLMPCAKNLSVAKAKSPSSKRPLPEGEGNKKPTYRQFLGALGVMLTLAIAASAQTPVQKQADKEYEVGAVLWQQSSGEQRALADQAFALAKMVLDRDLRINGRGKLSRAIVVDADEAFLDN